MPLIRVAKVAVPSDHEFPTTNFRERPRQMHSGVSPRNLPQNPGGSGRRLIPLARLGDKFKDLQPSGYLSRCNTVTGIPIAEQSLRWIGILVQYSLSLQCLSGTSVQICLVISICRKVQNSRVEILMGRGELASRTIKAGREFAPPGPGRTSRWLETWWDFYVIPFRR